MIEVRAFVGHSFTDDDASVVSQFLAMLKTIADTLPNFTWDHARAASSQDLAAKVLEKIEDKNTFIAICTRKERVLYRQDFALSTVFKYRVLQHQETEWKTSDWIIQEIGLAFGRGMKLILLVEHGVRQPGGLQGNIERIPFSRDNVSECFKPLLEMISSVAPLQVGAKSVVLEPPTVEAVVARDKNYLDEFERPDHSWDRAKYKRAFWLACMFNRKERAKAIDGSFLATADARNEVVSAEWIAEREYVYIAHADGGNIATIADLNTKFPNNRAILESLAKAHLLFEGYEQAVRFFCDAAKVSTAPAQRMDALANAAAAACRIPDASVARKLADEIRLECSGAGDCGLQALEHLQRIAEAQADKAAVLALMEAIADRLPDDYGHRFHLAFKHGEAGNKDLALLHYRRIPPAHRDGVGWNNLGATYSSLRLPINANSAYAAGKRAGETLAMSNMAFSLIDAGFVDEAQTELRAAESIPNHHANVEKGLVRIEERKESEEERIAEVTTRARKKSDFLRRFGAALCLPLRSELSGIWQHPKCEMTAKIVGPAIEMRGSFDRPSNALMAYALRGSVPLMGTPSMQTTRLVLQGTLKGCAIEGYIQRDDDGQVRAISILEAAGNSRQVLMYLSEDASELLAMEADGETPDFYVLKRVT